MAFEFREATCVVVGTFNIYIVRPDWLGKIGLIPESTPVRIESQLDQPGFRFSSPELKSRWTVLPNRLILETSDSTEDCGRTVDRILEALPWTPLMALGGNFAYRGNAADIDKWTEKTGFPPSQLPAECKLNQRSWHIGIQLNEQVFNLQVSELEEGVEIRANVHTDVRNREIDFARETARQFLAHRETAKALIQDLFDVRIENVVSNQ